MTGQVLLVVGHVRPVPGLRLDDHNGQHLHQQHQQNLQHNGRQRGKANERGRRRIAVQLLEGLVAANCAVRQIKD